MVAISEIKIGNKYVWPIIEGGKGLGVTNGITAGNFAKCNAIGTFSGANPRLINEYGEHIPFFTDAVSRMERHVQMIDYAIKAGISQAKLAFDISNGAGMININVLWEMGGAQEVLCGILDGAKGFINGITCGAGMPYKLAEIASQYSTFYYPIVSSVRAFRILWKRSYVNFSDWLGGVVYECPWRAGGHNGLSNAEDPNLPEDQYPRVLEIRKFMNEIGLEDVPIILAGGVWHINDFAHYLNNKEIGKIAFQFGTRPIFTKEYPVSMTWKKKLFELKDGDVFLNRFSPTGFYSSAVNNDFIKELRARSDRQIKFNYEKNDEHSIEIFIPSIKKSVYVKSHEDMHKILEYIQNGFDQAMETEDSRLIFISQDKKKEILQDRKDCIGCLSACKFSGWTTHDGVKIAPDPRSFCIQKTLNNIVDTGDVENNLMFSGKQSFRFKEDSWYKNGEFMPTIAELIDRIKMGL